MKSTKTRVFRVVSTIEGNIDSARTLVMTYGLPSWIFMSYNAIENEHSIGEPAWKLQSAKPCLRIDVNGIQ